MGNVYTGTNVKKVANIRIKGKDSFRLQFLIDRMHDWFVEEGWGPSDNHEFPERMFRLTEKQNGKKDWRIEWRLRRPITPFIRGVWDIDFNILDIEDIEIIHEGKKIKTNWSDCDINMVIRMDYDYGGNWSKHWLMKHFAVLFPKRIYRKEYYEYYDRIYRDAYALQQTIKNYWKYKSWVDEPEFGTIDRPKGLPSLEE